MSTEEIFLHEEEYEDYDDGMGKFFSKTQYSIQDMWTGDSLEFSLMGTHILEKYLKVQWKYHILCEIRKCGKDFR